MNHFVPTVVVDDFFENPDHIRDLALSVDYAPDPLHNWPGVRSAELGIIQPYLLSHVVNKALSLFYYSKEDIYGVEDNYGFYWTADAQFQKVDKQNFETGWIHKDSALITGLIYLNKNPSPNSGTSIYDIKTGFEFLNSNIQKKYNAGELTKEQALPALLENNSQFEETIRIKNKYNRLIMFDSNLWHGAQGYTDINDERDGDRLTLVFFITKFSVKKTPIFRMKNYN